jgi:hypothetical protein
VTGIDSKVSRAYRAASSDGPPAAIDAAILAAARERQTRTVRRARPSRVRWFAPVGVMATIVIGVSITLLLEREHPELTEGRVSPAGPPLAAEASNLPAAASAKPKPAGRALADVSAKKEAVVAGQSMAERVPGSLESAPPAPIAFPAEARSKSAAARIMEAPAAAATDSTGAGPAGANARVPASVSAPMQQPGARSAEAWLADIAALRQQGREQDARAQLAHFRKSYPNHPLPDSLRDLAAP